MRYESLRTSISDWIHRNQKFTVELCRYKRWRRAPSPCGNTDTTFSLLCWTLASFLENISIVLRCTDCVLYSNIGNIKLRQWGAELYQGGPTKYWKTKHIVIQSSRSAIILVAHTPKNLSSATKRCHWDATEARRGKWEKKWGTCKDYPDNYFVPFHIFVNHKHERKQFRLELDFFSSHSSIYCHFSS